MQIVTCKAKCLTVQAQLGGYKAGWGGVGGVGEAGDKFRSNVFSN